MAIVGRSGSAVLASRPGFLAIVAVAAAVMTFVHLSVVYCHFFALLLPLSLPY